MRIKQLIFTAYFRLLVLTLVSVIVSAALASESLELPKHILRPALCVGLLKAGSTLPHENPLVSLRDAQYLLRSLRKDPSLSLPTEQAYSNAVLDLRFSQPSRTHSFFENRGIEKASARLAQLENDSTKINFKGTTAGFEFRGTEQVMTALQTLTDSMNSTNTEALRLLREQYPLIRPGTIGRAATAGVLLVGLPLTMGIIGPLTGLGYLGLQEGFTRYNERYRTVAKIQPHLRLIEATLSDRSNRNTVSIFSGQTIISTDLHKILMDLEAKDLDEEGIDMVADAASDFYNSVFDPSYKNYEFRKNTEGMTRKQKIEYARNTITNLLAQHPEGFSRYIFYDSIFFVDPATHEPVWLLYYRAMKTRPIGPKSPGKKKQDVREAEKSWIPGLTPSLEPVRAR